MPAMARTLRRRLIRTTSRAPQSARVCEAFVWYNSSQMHDLKRAIIGCPQILCS